MADVDYWDRRTNVRDPLAERLIGPGKRFELEEIVVVGHRQAVIRDVPRTVDPYLSRAALFGDRLAMTCEGARFTYAELFGRAASLAAVLRDEFDVRRGSMVALAMGNRPEFVVSLIAIIAAGGIAALVNSRGVAEEMLHAIGTAGAMLTILDAERADTIAAALPDPAWPRIVSGAPASSLRPGRAGMAADRAFAEVAVSGDPAALAPEPMQPDDGAVILFTSGTTGRPKGALLSHGAVAHSMALGAVVSAIQDMRYEDEMGESLPEAQRAMQSPVVNLTPMFHLSGMIPILRSISVGSAHHIMGKWNADIAFDMIEQSDMTRLSFVPTMLWDMFRSPRANADNLGRIRYLAGGGAPLNPDIVAEIRARVPKCVLSNSYGQSENVAWACSISGRHYMDHPLSCGWAVPTVHVAVRRDDGTEAAIGEPGELWMTSASVMTGYISDAKATAETVVDGWMATGDIGFVDAEGLFTIVDRRKNMVISGGENIYCAEVERVLSLRPDILESVAYGIPDERLGERLVVEVYVAAGSDLDADRLKAHCREHLAIYKVPRVVHILRVPLPRTATGKIDRMAVMGRALTAA
jgi:long-chain acyl-CoA synthetase